MKNKKYKIIIDILMFLILIVELIPVEIIPLQIHAIAGVVFTGLFIIHILLNRKMCIAFTKAFKAGKLNWKTKLQYIVDWLLLIIWILVVLTGFPAMDYAMGEEKEFIIFRNIHIVFAIIGTILIAIHIFQHRSQILAYIKQKNKQ